MLHGWGDRDRGLSMTGMSRCTFDVGDQSGASKGSVPLWLQVVSQKVRCSPNVNIRQFIGDGELQIQFQPPLLNLLGPHKSVGVRCPSHLSVR